jgi:hypothetical protein
MTSCRAALGAVALLLAGLGSAARADVIYDNTMTSTGSTAVTRFEIGSEVNAAGTARLVTDLLIALTSQHTPGTADLQARLYAADGPGGRPGTLLWEGPVLQDVHLTGDIDLIDFAVPLVLVPDTFVWTVQAFNATPNAVGLPTFGPPTVGSSSANWFGDSTTGWTQVGGANDPFGARVEAAPEPSSFLLVLPGLGLVLWRLRSRRRARPEGQAAPD